MNSWYYIAGYFQGRKFYNLNFEELKFVHFEGCQQSIYRFIRNSYTSQIIKNIDSSVCQSCLQRHLATWNYFRIALFAWALNISEGSSVSDNWSTGSGRLLGTGLKY